MRRSLFLLATFLLSGLFAFTQEGEKGDKKSREILDRLTEKTESYTTMQAEFTYKMENTEAGIDESTEGVLAVMGDSYKLNIAGQIVICDGETVYTVIEEEEIQINSLEESEESLTPNKLLNSYSDDYKSKFIREDFRYGTTVNIVDLTPIEGKTYYKVRLVIDKAKDQLQEITIFDKNGSTYSYVINKFSPDLPLSAEDFIFKEEDYPGLEIVDMR